MKKANFDTLKNLPVPESWIENALLIPGQEKKKAAVIPFWRRKGAIALAASLVLVSVLSVILFSQIDTKPPLKTKSTATESVSPTEVIGDSTTDPTPEEATEPKTVIDRVKDVIDSIFHTPTETQGSGSTNPTTASDHKKNTPTEPQAQSPTAKPGTRPTESAKPSEVLSPTQGEKATETPVYPTAPQRETEEPSPTEDCFDPTYAPDRTEPAWEEPTYAPDHTGPAQDPNTPTEPNVRPTIDPNYVPETVSPTFYTTIQRSIPASWIPQGSVLYIKLEDSKGELIGDSNLYSDQHLLPILGQKDNQVEFSYTPNTYGIITKNDKYRYTIYNQYGITVFHAYQTLKP
ncbi:MAG: hypothetical protein IJV48_06130 [Ruminococcus sp.]|nr:hypothetical protein [Ruminococcus sp.]